MGGFDIKRMMRRPALVLAAVLVAAPAGAERIENQVAVFSALDKITARISRFEVVLGETATFGQLKVTPRVCFSRPSTEQPKTTTFVEVDEVQLDGNQKRIFTGWMFAESPGLHAVEHPVFDVWLTECQKPKTVAVAKPQKPADAKKPVAAKPNADAAIDPEAGVADPTWSPDGAIDGAPEGEPGAAPEEGTFPEEPADLPRRRVRR